jgi:hypothetical protein
VSEWSTAAAQCSQPVLAAADVTASWVPKAYHLGRSHFSTGSRRNGLHLGETGYAEVAALPDILALMRSSVPNPRMIVSAIEDGRVGFIGGDITGPIVSSLKNISLPGSGGFLSIWSTLNQLIFTLAWARSGELPWMLKPG